MSETRRANPHVLSRVESGPDGWVHVKHASDDVGRDQLRREAEVLAALSHPNVVEVTTTDRDALATRLVGRRSLADCLAASPGPNRAEILVHARALVQIVDDLHHMGWTHGGIEPSHLVVGPEGRLTLCSWRRAGRRNTRHVAFDEDRTAVATTIAAMQATLPPAGTRAERGIDRQLEQLGGTPGDDTARSRGDRAMLQVTSTRHSGRTRRADGAGVLAAIVAAVAAAAIVWVLAGTTFGEWPNTSGSPVALTSGVLRGAALAGALYVAIASAVLAAARALDATRLAATALAALPRPLRRALAGLIGAGVLSLAAPRGATHAPVAATTTTTVAGVTPPTITTTTSRSTASSSTALPSTTSTPAAPAPAPTLAPVPTPPAVAVPSADTWQIAPGDHLWSVAETTVTMRIGRTPTDREVSRYWRRLISANRSALIDPANPDLVVVGQLIHLPE